jgi:hypothetical protein
MIIFDLDGTLSIVGTRLEHIRKNPPDWDAFYLACGEDEPNEPVCDIYRMIYFNAYQSYNRQG